MPTRVLTRRSVIWLLLVVASLTTSGLIGFGLGALGTWVLTRPTDPGRADVVRALAVAAGRSVPQVEQLAAGAPGRQIVLTVTGTSAQTARQRLLDAGFRAPQAQGACPSGRPAVLGYVCWYRKDGVAVGVSFAPEAVADGRTVLQAGRG
jgi:hypothetical protein